eukprot:gene21011-40953_t
MRTKGHQDFTLGSLEAYVNMRVLAEGLERAGSDPSRAKLRTALAGIRNWDMGVALCGLALHRPRGAQRRGPFPGLIALPGRARRRARRGPWSADKAAVG